MNILNSNYFNKFPPTRDRIVSIINLDDHMNEMFNRYFNSVKKSHLNFKSNSHLCTL